MHLDEVALLRAQAAIKNAFVPIPGGQMMDPSAGAQGGPPAPPGPQAAPPPGPAQTPGPIPGVPAAGLPPELLSALSAQGVGGLTQNTPPTTNISISIDDLIKVIQAVSGKGAGGKSEKRLQRIESAVGLPPEPEQQSSSSAQQPAAPMSAMPAMPQTGGM